MAASTIGNTSLPVDVNGNPAVSTAGVGSSGSGAILNGFANVQTTTTTTLVTVPAGKTWIGTIGMSAAAANSGAVATAATATSAVDVNGAGAIPAAGVVARVDAIAAANVAAGTVGSDATASIAGQPLTVIAPAGNSVLIRHVATITNGSNMQASAWAVGVQQ